MDSPNPSSVRPSPLDWFFRGLGFVALVATGFSLPGFATAELDSSWRMALGKFFLEGRQFGTEVVFTYGPLGWTMGKTYWGDQWGALIGWHAAQALVMAILVYWHAFRLTGYNRVFFLLFYLLFGLTYQDAIQQTGMALAGFELIRRANRPWRWSSVALLLLLVAFSLVKFTNLLLGGFVVLLAGALELARTRRPTALLIPALFGFLFLGGWMLCGQHLGNLPAYFRSSLEISSGYQDSMGLSCPPVQLYLGVIVAAFLVTYLALNVVTQTDRLRGVALSLGAAAYLYLNWKHGFIRADGHQIGFYYAVLTVIVGTPLVLEDGPRLRSLKIALLSAAAGITLIGMELVLPGLTRGGLMAFQAKLDRNIYFVLHRAEVRQEYDGRLENEKNGLKLTRTMGEVRTHSLDVLGFEQGVAIFNEFNYQPRPVFQSYSAYTPYLSRLNYDYFASDRAPDYLLFKLQSIDGRLATMDDPHVLRLLVQRYTYIFSEQGFTLWKKRPGPFRAVDFEPQPVRTIAAKLGQKIAIAELADQNLWVEANYRFSLIGRLRRFLFKPPVVQLTVTDQAGVESVYRLPQPIGRAGFMINPIVNDMMDYMRAAGGVPSRRIATIMIDTARQDRDCVQDEVSLAFSRLPASEAGKDYFKNADKAKFHMFVDPPTSYEALNPPNEDEIERRRVMIMHAPSHMVFEVPAGATEIRGAYGFVPGAYSSGGRTNGAEFVISWSDGNDPVVLSERYLNPVAKVNDRGLQKFALRLPKGTGRVTLEIKPGLYGEYAYDWTGWTGIEFK